MEEETQCAAHAVRAYIMKLMQSSQLDTVLLAARLPMIEATVKTHEEWIKSLRQGGNDGQPFVMEKDTFTLWCSLFGRCTS